MPNWRPVEASHTASQGRGAGGAADRRAAGRRGAARGRRRADHGGRRGPAGEAVRAGPANSSAVFHTGRAYGQPSKIGTSRTEHIVIPVMRVSTATGNDPRSTRSRGATTGKSVLEPASLQSALIGADSPTFQASPAL